MKSAALFFIFMVSVKFTYGFLIFHVGSSGQQDISSSNVDDYSHNELDYKTPLREGDRNDYFVKELMNSNQDDEMVEEEEYTDADDSSYMYQSLPETVVRKPFYYPQEPTRNYYNYQPRSYYPPPFMFREYYQPWNNYYNRYDRHPWFYGMRPFHPYFYY